MTEDRIFEDIWNAVVSGDQARSRSLAEEALRLALDPALAMEKGYIPGIQRVGDLF